MLNNQTLKTTQDPNRFNFSPFFCGDASSRPHVSKKTRFAGALLFAGGNEKLPRSLFQNSRTPVPSLNLSKKGKKWATLCAFFDFFRDNGTNALFFELKPKFRQSKRLPVQEGQAMRTLKSCKTAPGKLFA